MRAFTLALVAAFLGDNVDGATFSAGLFNYRFVSSIGDGITCFVLKGNRQSRPRRDNTAHSEPSTRISREKSIGSPDEIKSVIGAAGPVRAPPAALATTLDAAQRPSVLAAPSERALTFLRKLPW
ncbi:hypothetical protein PT974_05743 [Cladobotryum mycophilum]|uniref:Secreted protein n=1 Tax=Cladobotryum mycophilum TaxID=491253 RepID=A0ABR0SKR3_9HYPO